MKIADLKNGFQYGMHGCGYFKGTEHVNAYESFKYWQSKGVKVMEIDMTQSLDGKYIALAHLMNERYLRMLEILPPYRDTEYKKFTEEWFLNKKICQQTTDGLTPMNLSAIVNEMEKDPEIILMFDLWRMWSKEETQKFADELTKQSKDVQGRCVLEVYNKDMIEGIRIANPDLQIMYCVHGNREPEYDQNVNPSLLKELGIDIISYPWSFTKEFPGELEKYHQLGFTIFSLSTDNRYNAQMRKAGVNVNLVDTLYTPTNAIKLYFEKIIYKLSFYGRILKNKMSGPGRAEMTIEEVHEVSLEMMKEIHEFCIDNDIQYSLAYGSLIGAIRHKGFIPWDDDIDVWMTRPNFEKFTKLYRSKRGYRLSSIYDSDSLIAFDRVYETQSTYVKHGIKSCDGKTGVWVDIMPLDGVPDDESQQVEQYKSFSNLIGEEKDYRFWAKIMENGGDLRDFYILVRMIMKKIKNGTLKNLFNNRGKVIQKEMVALCKKYNYGEGLNCCYFQCGDAFSKKRQELLPVNCFTSYTLTDFEDTKLMITCSYDILLKGIYGDYMVLPPIEKRQKSHGLCYWQ